jgi:Flp pilus assembly protein TadG
MMRKEEQKKSNRRERGQAMVEVTLLCPWIFFLFVGILDFGFYAYSAICVQTAARSAAIQTASGVGSFFQSDTLACNSALNELNLLPNVVGVSSCAALPVKVTRKTLCNAAVGYVTCDATGCADCASEASQAPCSTTPTSCPASSQVAVTYQSTLFVPIPGILTNQLNMTRIAEARIINE